MFLENIFSIGSLDVSVLQCAPSDLMWDLFKIQ